MEEENREEGFCDNLLEMKVTREEMLCIINFFISYFEIKQNELDFSEWNGKNKTNTRRKTDFKRSVWR